VINLKASSKDGAFLWFFAAQKQAQIIFHQPPTTLAL
jgi:hypothetical protein